LAVLTATSTVVPKVLAMDYSKAVTMVEMMVLSLAEKLVDCLAAYLDNETVEN
jgi:hypothetical protein